MNSLHFSNQEANFDMHFEEGEHTPGYGLGDFRVQTTASSNGFSGANHCWVDRESLRAFVLALRELERTRMGEATLGSMSPGELAFRIFSTSSLGHLAVDGTISHRFPGENHQHIHSLQIGFEIDPSELVAAAQNSWVLALAP